jgi:hypothetical protein
MSVHQCMPSVCDVASADVDLPRRLWRQVLLKPPVPVGGAALVIGTKPITAAERLGEFGLEVLALCDDPAAVLEGRLRCPSTDFQRFDPTNLARLTPQAFDLVLVLDTVPWPVNLLGRTARMLSATVLATVKPGRRLLWRHESVDGAAHQAGCWFRHLACFPGAIDVQSVSVPRWPLTVFRPVRRRETTVVEFTTPDEPVVPREWRRCVEKGLLTDRRSCCGTAVAVRDVRVA